MATVAYKIDQAVAPPAMGDDAIDWQHLARMTLGERDLEREVLALFRRQAELLIKRMRHGEPAVVATAAHTLKGSAQGIGAWRVAEAADAVERADATTQGAAVDALEIATEQAGAAIDRRLGPR